MSRRLRWLWILLAVALVVRTGVRDRGVITDHLEFGARLLRGADLYAPFEDQDAPLHPPYPPSFGLLTAPFSLLPERVARFAWGVLQVCALGAALVWLRRRLVEFAPALRARVDVALLLTAGLATRYILRDTHGGGGNLINLGLVLGAFGASAAGRERLGGALLGISLATKPNTVLLWPLLWLFGHRRAAWFALLTAGLAALASLALLRFDPACWLRWGAGTYAYTVQVDVFAPPEYGFPPFTWMNQCWRCACARVCGDVPPEYAQQVVGFVPGLGLPLPVVSAIRGLSTTALLAWTAVVAWRRRRDPRARPALIAATLALSLLLSPISWKAHHVALLPAFGLLFAAALCGRRAAWWIAGAYALACVGGEELTGKAFKEWQQSSYFVTAGTLALLWVALRLARRPPCGDPPG